MTDRAHDYEIIRHKVIPGYAKFGRLFDAAGQELVVTVERPWLDANADGNRDTGLSCFVPGLFEAFIRKAGTGKRDYDLWEFANIPAITNGQIHIANFPWELNGCVGVGTAFGDVEYRGPTVTEGPYPREHGKRYPGVTASRTAHEKWMKDTLALCAREQRDRIWIRVTDRTAA